MRPKMTLKHKIRTYWDARPCNISHSDHPLGSLEYSKEVTHRKLSVEPHIAWFSQFAHWKGKTVLDLGCGIGTQALLFAYAGANVVAVDISARSLWIARARALEHGLTEQMQFCRADIEDPWDWAPQIGCTYDLVYSFGVLHHTPFPGQGLRGLHPFLKRSAELRIMVYHQWAWKWLWVLAQFGKWQWWKWRKLICAYSEAQTGCPYTDTYTRRGITRLLQKAGYDVQSIQVAHIFPYIISEYKKGHLVKEWYWDKMPSWLFSWLERHFGLHLLVIAVPSKEVHKC